MFLLDTNVVSTTRRADRLDPNVRSWTDSVQADDVFLSVVTLFEIELGILSVQRRDPQQANTLRRWLQTEVMPRFEGRILNVDMSVAVRCAPLHVPDPKPERDAFIAATALVHGFTLVTRNEADFAPMGVRLLNPWRPQR